MTFHIDETRPIGLIDAIKMHYYASIFFGIVDGFWLSKGHFGIVF